MTSKSPSQALPTNGLHLRTCHLCEAMCGLELEVQEGRVTSLRGDKNDPFSQGHLCPKAMGLLDLHEDPDRLTRPQIREGNRFREASWEEAFALVVDRIGNLQEKYGRNAFAVYQGNPTVHNYGTMLMVTLFDGALRTKNRFSATSLDQLPHMLAALEMFGHQLALPIPDIDNTDFLLMLGANPVASNGSLMSAPNIKGKLQKIISRGGRVLVVDPRRTETAELASEHVFLRPGTDALFLFALLHVLFDEGLARPGRLLPLLDGFEDIVTLAAPFTPEQVAPYTGVPATTIRSIARSFAAAPRAACYGRIGISTQRFGGLSCWLVNVLNIVSGNLDRVGGVLFTKPAVDVVGLSAKVGQKGHFGVRKSRVRGLPEFGGEFPSAALAEEIETPGAGQIRGLLTSCGNPVLSAPHGQRLDRALAGLEFMVSVDIYLNETTRHAHVILPPTFGLEHDHYDLIFHALAVRNTAKYSPALFPKSPDARHDWEIFLALTTGLLARRGWRSRAKALAQDAVVKALGPSGILDVLLRSGPYGDKFLPGLDGMSLAKLKATPHGIDLGALQPSLPSSLHTANKRISLVPEVFRKDIPRLAAGLASPPPPPETLLLIGRRDLRSNNSWMHNSTRLVKGPERCTLRMHPTDATPRGIKHGEKARIQSATGTIEATAELSDEIMPGVVSLPHGWGHHRSGTQWRVAEAHAGVSLNDITDDQLVDDLTGNAAFSGVPVQVAGATTSSESPPLAPS